MRNSVRAGVTATAALGLVLLGAGTALAATPTETVTPSTGLTDGQQVTVVGSGFSAGASITVFECLSNESTPSCDTADEVTATADSTGAYTATLTVRATFEGTNPLTGADAGAVDCTASPGCAVASLDSSLDYAAVAITFG